MYDQELKDYIKNDMHEVCEYFGYAGDHHDHHHEGEVKDYKYYNTKGNDPLHKEHSNYISIKEVEPANCDDWEALEVDQKVGDLIHGVHIVEWGGRIIYWYLLIKAN